MPASNLTLIVASVGLFAFYLAVASRFSSDAVDRMIAAWVLSLGHCVSIPLVLMFLHGARFWYVIGASACVVGLIGWRLRIGPPSVGRAVGETSRLLGHVLSGSGWAWVGALPTLAVTGTVAYWIVGGSLMRDEVLSGVSAVRKLCAQWAVPCLVLLLFRWMVLILRKGLTALGGGQAQRSNSVRKERGAWYVFATAFSGAMREVKAGWFLIPLLLCLILLTVKFVWGVLLVPFTNDGISLHLPMATNILQNGRYADYWSHMPADEQSWHPFMDGYGKNLALLHFWTLCLSREDTFLFVFSWGSALFTVLAVFSLCRTFGCSKRAALFAAPLALFNRISPDQMNTCMQDQIVSGLIVVAAWAAFRPFSLMNTVLLAINTGLAGGTHRFTVLPACLLALGVYFARSVCTARRDEEGTRGAQVTVRGAVKRLLPGFILALTIFGLLGLNQYLLNAVVFKNPFYPFDYSVFGHHFQGPTVVSTLNASTALYRGARTMIGRLIVSVFTLWNNYQRSSRSGGWDLIFPFVMLPAHAAAIWFNRRNLPYLLFADFAWLTLFVTAQMYWLRYSLFFFFLSAVPVAVVLDRCRKMREGLALGIGILAVLVVVRGGFVVGPRGIVFSDWREYLRLDNRWDRSFFLSPHPTSGTARDLHQRALGKDVIYTDTRKKFLFWNRHFENRVEAVDYKTAAELLAWISRYNPDDPVIVARRDSDQDRALSQSEDFRCVYTNRAEALYKPVPSD